MTLELYRMRPDLASAMGKVFFSLHEFDDTVNTKTNNWQSRSQTV